MATNATFNKPIGVAIDSSGNIYVADNANHQIRKIDSSGNVTTLGGQVGIAGSTNGQGTDVKFNKPVVININVDPNALISFRKDSFKNRKK